MVNYSKKTLDKKEQQIKKKYEPLRFHTIHESKIKTLKDLFHQLFNETKGNDTYLLNGKIDCGISRGRSYYDAYRLCMNYFPELSFAEMYTTLRKYIGLSNPKYKRMISYWSEDRVTACFWTCSVIGKSRFEGKLIFK